MWNNVPLLQAVASWALILALVGGIVAASAGAIGAWASSRAAHLEKSQGDLRVARANARAEVAHAQAAAARLEAARISQGLAWRVLRPEQRSVLVDSLRGNNFHVYNTFVGRGPEAAQYREQIDEALREAGIETHFFSGWDQAAGVAVLGNDTADRRRLSEALTQAGIQHRVRGPEGIFGRDYPALIIGTKLERL